MSPRTQGNASEFHGVACVPGIHVYVRLRYRCSRERACISSGRAVKSWRFKATEIRGLSENRRAALLQRGKAIRARPRLSARISTFNGAPSSFVSASWIIASRVNTFSREFT